MILLDTNAVVWLVSGHKRARPLDETSARLHLSPVTLLELQFLVEIGKLELRAGASVSSLLGHPRWALDNPPSSALFSAALPLTWTRDPFDRLLVAHALHRRWRLATGDARLCAQLGDAALAL
jgi:PIN domain nuclease of toxin-antitoxin system